MSFTTVSYVYEPVDTAANEIRMLTLLPGKFDDPVFGLLTKLVLPTRSQIDSGMENVLVPDYKALSYVWGSTLNPGAVHIRTSSQNETIQVLGGSTRTATTRFGTLQITANLAVALPYLRDEDEPVQIWIDAICVNQADLKERGEQVQRMADIFSLADKVTVWLGEADDETERVIKLVHWVNNRVWADLEALGIFHRLWEWPLPEKEGCSAWMDDYYNLSIGCEEVLSLVHFLEKPWFSRLWVWQEIHLAQHAMIQCGECNLDWSIFRNVMLIIGSYRDSLKETKKIAIHLHYRETMASSVRRLDKLLKEVWDFCTPIGSYSSLFEIAQRTRNSHCRDPRDRVYALLSLSWETDATFPQPDYTKEVYRIYQEATEHMIQTKGSLNVLVAGSAESNRMGLPTWAVDFSSLPPIDLQMRGFDLNTITNRSLTLQNGRVFAQGVKFDTVEAVYCIQQSDKDYMAGISAWLHGAFSSIDIQDVYPSGDATIIEALSETLIKGRWSESWFEGHDLFPSANNAYLYHDHIIAMIQSSTTPAPSKECLKYIKCLEDATKSCEFYITKKGFFGLGPPLIAEGDIITTVLGCPLPMALRPSLRDKEELEVVGAVYCSAVMKGESLLGPLPAYIDYVIEQRSNQQIYVDKATRRKLPSDPRLGNLPPGWQQKLCLMDGVELEVFEELSTGDIFESDEFDPRLDPQELRKRGVIVEELVLV